MKQSDATPIAVALVMCLLWPAVASADQPAPQIVEAQRALLAHVEEARRVLGNDVANDVLLRVHDENQPHDYERPADVTPEVWNERLATVARLDASLVTQVLGGPKPELGSLRGLAETLVHSSVDGTWQPVAVYVPPSYSGEKPLSLAMILHGRPQTEVELLSDPVWQHLADATGTILMAPWGRGLYDFAEPGATDAYDALDAGLAAWRVDPHRTYLVGYSMGGFSVFGVGPKNGARWAAVMSVAGALLNSKTAATTGELRAKPFYIVNGARDESIPPNLGAQTASYLGSIGMSVSFYQEPQGTHSISTLEPALRHAWSDMLAGVRQPRPLTESSGTAPSSGP